MDVDRFAGTRVDKDGNVERRLAFNRARGARLSAMEHLVPEQMYSTDDAPAHGISAVKAIQLAAAKGQKIWTITQGNLDQALASIELSDEVETDIRNSVYAGKEVTAHERPVNFFGSQSSGYFFTYLVITFTAGLAGAVIPLIIGEMVGLFQSQINELARKYACLG
ncbi:MAG: hypothetical protein CL539_08735 [Alcanivorax sp.]|jgi:hypothetical protein|uniref:hypothetical protein n=1 Tax=Alcanivorax TaxID=59753 RepID=UPI000C67D1D1|nr:MULTISPECIES: hypothetical protein [Alcanivorax]MAC14735.1 hypothetical protein [Alcanivorax sp.]MBG32628.1 hypothetical protein [Alcanivorax sp.]MDF1635934.1 hypothetical protein [Alcanivorax jadensis]|tara:strand:- start:1857 stop:2354 length:498 start_codon:yes stop_codon:yes gene_type:complete